MKRFLLLCLALLPGTLAEGVFAVRHSFDGVNWSLKGHATLTRGSPVPIVTYSSEAIPSAEIDEVVKLASTSGLYYVGLAPCTRDETGNQKCSSTPTTFTSTQACRVLGSNFREKLILNVDSTGTVFAVDYNAGTVCRTRPEGKHATSFTTTAVVSGPVEPKRIRNDPPPPPPLPAGQDAPENQSFLSKYWYVIMSVLLVMSIQNLFASPEQPLLHILFCPHAQPGRGRAAPAART